MTTELIQLTNDAKPAEDAEVEVISGVPIAESGTSATREDPPMINSPALIPSRPADD